MKIKNVIRLSVFIFALLNTNFTYSQQAIIKASVDSTHLLIGEQTLLRLEIAADKNTELQLPFIQSELMKGVEVLNISQPDTADIGNGRIEIKYDYLITSFDSALYQIPAFPLVVGADTIYSNDLALKVSTLPVDTESKSIYDIKDVIRPKLVWSDYIQILLIILGASILILLIIYIIYRMKKEKPIMPFKKAETIILPPHVVAIQALDEIKREKLWQAGKEKEYHSQITDVIRRYINTRFEVDSMEMTSKQILASMRGISDVDLVFDKLKQMLLLGDLVKFAKYHPLPDENEMSMMNAYLFVNGTKIEEIVAEKAEKENEEYNKSGNE